MDTSNWRPTQGGSGGGGDPSMESTDWRTQLQADWGQRIVSKSNIMDTLKRHLPFSGQEGLQELEKMAVGFEEKIYTAATSESDYVRKITLKLLTMETKSQNAMTNSMQSSSAGNSVNPQDLVKEEEEKEIKEEVLMLNDQTIEMTDRNPNSKNSASIYLVESGGGGDPFMESEDWRTQLQADLRQRIVSKLMDTLKRHLPFSRHEGLQELEKIAVTFEERIYTAATSQSDYLRIISLKLLTMEINSQNAMTNSMQSNSARNSVNPQD